MKIGLLSSNIKPKYFTTYTNNIPASPVGVSIKEVSVVELPFDSDFLVCPPIEQFHCNLQYYNSFSNK